MKVRFNSHVEALSAKERAGVSLARLNDSLYLIEGDMIFGYGYDEEEYLHFLSCFRKQKTLLKKINTWLEANQRRLAESKKELLAKKRKWSPSSLANHKMIRSARRDSRDFREHPEVFETRNSSYDEYRDLNVDIELSREYFYRTGHFDKFEESEDGNNSTEVACYECGGDCRQYEEYEYTYSYNLSNETRQDDFPFDNDHHNFFPEPEDCIECGGSCSPGFCIEFAPDEVYDPADEVCF